ncbi:MAG: hypothetical protein R3A12_16035 [Ignavibacteria bacterium]
MYEYYFENEKDTDFDKNMKKIGCIFADRIKRYRYFTDTWY